MKNRRSSDKYLYINNLRQMSFTMFSCILDLNTGIQDTERNKPVFYSEIHRELIIKDECEDIKTGNS